MNRKILIATAMAASIAAFSAQASKAEDNSIRTLRASEQQVATACEMNEGQPLAITIREDDYGCTTRAGWVDCRADGHCTAARFDGDIGKLYRSSHPHSALSDYTLVGEYGNTVRR